MKKKMLIIAVVLFAMLVFTVNAQQGGFRGPGAVTITVVEARTLSDDTPVILQGRIERFLGNEKFLFADNTGNIVVEIDDRVWGSLSIDQNDLVEISGEIDREWNSVEVEVRTIRKL